jgi:glycogen operon protein
MPIQQFDDDIPFSNTNTGEELINYWGYSPLNYFSLHPQYFASGDNTQINEFQDFVKAAHQHGLEVIIDVVYNHTTESSLGGPTLNFRGIDNRNYYITAPDDRRFYQDYTGCGNTLNTNTKVVSKMTIDSLTYLATTFHVDGFRFDLGTIFYYDQDAMFTDEPQVIKLINDHPILGKLKLIAEPWDASGNVIEGRFGGPQWLEWNGSYRDRLRRYINFGEEEHLVSEHLNGYAPEFMAYNKDPYTSINYITSHDGFTLRDLASYDRKHNWENSFNNSDGADHNYSYNGGVEGETDDENIKRERQDRAKAMLELLFATPGIPMLTMGDEMWRTQGGNNNPFCQDNSITWLNWELLGENKEWFEWVKDLIWRYRRGET